MEQIPSDHQEDSEPAVNTDRLQVIRETRNFFKRNVTFIKRCYLDITYSMLANSQKKPIMVFKAPNGLVQV